MNTDHSFYSIVSSKNHWLSPFTYQASGTSRSYQLSTKQKVAAVALTIFTGIIGAGIGGVICFYLLTAYFKSRNITKMDSSKISSVASPNMHVYTTGLADKNVQHRWDRFYIPHIEKKFPNTQIVYNHYDPEFSYGLRNGGSLARPQNIFKENFDPTKIASQDLFDDLSVVFDFAHSINDYEKHPNTLYIPYEQATESEKFLDFGLQPFTINNGQIDTYISKLVRHDFRIVERELEFLDKSNKPIKIPFKTIEMDGAVFDTEEKLLYLYRLIKEFNLPQFSKLLEIAKFKAEILEKSSIESGDKFLGQLNQIMQL